METYVVVMGLFGLILVIVGVLLYYINKDQKKMTEVEHLVSRDEGPFLIKKKNPLFNQLKIFSVFIALLGMAIIIFSLFYLFNQPLQFGAVFLYSITSRIR
jgi:hypothetical protein